MSMLRDAAEWQASMLEQFESAEVVYQFGVEEVTLRATEEPKPLQVQDASGGVRVEWSNMDWVIRAAALVANGVAIVPRAGHRIRKTAGDKTYVFEVLAPAGEPVWRWSGPAGVMRRIHSKLIATE